MPLVHELKFGAINQLSGIYLYKCIHLRSFHIKGGLYPLICCKFSKMYKAKKENIIKSRFHCSNESHV